ncbi:MAG: hypothetical protein LBS57_12195 [Treponema sp.]|nr:hypothetical protein [Treponema sp.]
MINETQLDYIRKKINEIEHGKITIVIQDKGAKIDIITEKRERIEREESFKQPNLVKDDSPCSVKRLRPSQRINTRKDEEYLTRTAKQL